MHGLLKRLLVAGGYWNEQGADGGAGGGGEPGGAAPAANELANQTPAAGAAPGSETGGEPAPAATDDGSGAPAAEPKPVDPATKRYSDLTKQLRDSQEQQRRSQEQLDAALKALERVTGGPAPKPAETPKAVEDPEPVPPEFVDPEQYQRDMAEYVRKVGERSAKQALAAAEANRERDRIAGEAEAQKTAHATAWNTRRQKAVEKYDDYVQVAENPTVPITPAMALTITSLDNGGEVAYYLGQHVDEALRISQLPPVLQAVELGKLEVKVMTPPKPAVSKAADPIKPLTGNGQPQARSDDELSMEEYAAKRNRR